VESMAAMLIAVPEPFGGALIIGGHHGWFDTQAVNVHIIDGHGSLFLNKTSIQVAWRSPLVEQSSWVGIMASLIRTQAVTHHRWAPWLVGYPCCYTS